MHNFVHARTSKQNSFQLQILQNPREGSDEGEKEDYGERESTAVAEQCRMSQEWLEMLKKVKADRSSSQYKYKFKPKKNNQKILKYNEIVGLNGSTEPLIRAMEQYQKNNLSGWRSNDFLPSQEKIQASCKAYLSNLPNRSKAEESQKQRGQKNNSFTSTFTSQLGGAKGEQLQKIPHFPLLNYHEHRQQEIYNAYLAVASRERNYSKNMHYLKLRQMKLKESNNFSNRYLEEKKKNMAKMVIEESDTNEDLPNTGTSATDNDVEMLHRNLIIASGPLAHHKTAGLKQKQGPRSVPGNTKRGISPLLQNLFYTSEVRVKKEKFIQNKDDGTSIAAKIEECICFKDQGKGNRSNGGKMRRMQKMKEERKGKQEIQEKKRDLNEQNED